MLHVLTDELCMCVEFVESGWTVDSLLERVANAEPRFHALIDTGALITGLGNKGVAQRLLDLGLGRWCEIAIEIAIVIVVLAIAIVFVLYYVFAR